jgi:uncharacterized protein YbjT (DUF2867 family)
MEAAMAGQDVYANLAGALEPMARSLVAAMKASRLKRLIFISSMGIYDEVPGDTHGSALEPYCQLAAIVEASDLDYTIIRPAWLNDRKEIAYGTIHEQQDGVAADWQEQVSDEQYWTKAS